MKPILMNINEMSDSREVYDSKPSSIFAIFIYTILGIITVALIWTYFGRIDIVIKSKDKGTFHLSCLPVPLSSPQCLPCVNNPVPTSPPRHPSYSRNRKILVINSSIFFLICFLLKLDYYYGGDGK